MSKDQEKENVPMDLETAESDNNGSSKKKGKKSAKKGGKEKENNGAKKKRYADNDKKDGRKKKTDPNAPKVNGAEVGPDGENKKKHKAGSYDTLVFYIRKVLKETNNEMGIKGVALAGLDLILENISNRIDNVCMKLCKSGKRVTITARQVKTATKILLRGDLRNNALIHGEKALMNYNKNTQKKPKVQA